MSLHQKSELPREPRAAPAARGALSASKVPVLAYHSVSRRPQPRGLEYLVISPEKFRAQVRWLASHGFSAIRIKDLVAWNRMAAPLPRKPVFISFDDAYADIAEFALPILREHEYCATVFAITGLLGESTPWDRAPVMNRGEVRFWASRGIEFGSHTRTHPDLTTLGPQALAREILGSADDLGMILGERVEAFAYPYGRFSEPVSRMASETYAAAFTCEPGLNFRTSEPSLLRRTVVRPEDRLLGFGMRLALGRNPTRLVLDPIGAFRRVPTAVESRWRTVREVLFRGKLSDA